MTLTGDGFCPHCGAARAGWAKFCGSCGKPYDTVPAPAIAPTTQPTVTTGPPAAPTVPPRNRSKILVRIGLGLAVLALVVLLVSGRLITLPGGAPGVSAANVPPAGTIWFGSSFDTTTFEIRGRTATVGAHSGFSAVAHLSRSMSGSAVSMRVSWNGSAITSNAMTWPGSGDIWGFSPGPLIEPGVWTFDLTDVGGNVLASGSVNAQ